MDNAMKKETVVNDIAFDDWWLKFRCFYGIDGKEKKVLSTILNSMFWQVVIPFVTSKILLTL